MRYIFSTRQRQTARREGMKESLSLGITNRVGHDVAWKTKLASGVRLASSVVEKKGSSVPSM